MDDQYELINPPNAGAPPPPPVAPNPPPPPAAAGAGPDGADSTLLQTKTDLKSDVKIAADPSAMPEAQDFGQSAYTSPVPPVDSKSQKDNAVVTEKPRKKRSVVWMVVFGALTVFFLLLAIGGAIGAFALNKEN